MPVCENKPMFQQTEQADLFPPQAPLHELYDSDNSESCDDIDAEYVIREAIAEIHSTFSSVHNSLDNFQPNVTDGIHNVGQTFKETLTNSMGQFDETADSSEIANDVT